MTKRPCAQRFGLWGLAVAAFLGASFVTGPAVASGDGEADHLKCFNVFRDFRAEGQKAVTLETELGVENCVVHNLARVFCAPAIKDGRNDNLGSALTSDYLCYQVECPSLAQRTLFMIDQFGAREIKIAQPRILCAPA